MTGLLTRTTPCRGCGKQIAFFKTQQGKSMPVDPEAVYFIPADRGKKYVMPDGSVKTGREPREGDGESSIGYVSHFATCPEADRFRKRK